VANNSAQYNLIVCSDFDGTIAKGDVGNRLFHYFSAGKSDVVVDLWKKNEIDSRQCLIDEAASMKDITEEELYKFIDKYEIDESFIPFVELLDSKNIPLYILSDGLDIYIKRLLGRENLDKLPIFANKGTLINGRLRFEFPFIEQSCGSCANCKGYHLRKLRKPGNRIVYIGDGKSDTCAVKEADIIFAKDYLAQYCKNEGIEFLPFTDFSAISKLLNREFSI
jgi:2,3-diketo-5-methylthio-1-phosphopentane phosphatase